MKNTLPQVPSSTLMESMRASNRLSTTSAIQTPNTRGRKPSSRKVANIIDKVYYKIIFLAWKWLFNK